MPHLGVPPQASFDFRSHFPALQSQTAFFENAGGTQMPHQAVRRMREFLESDNVQLGAPYPQSERATQIVADAHTFLNRQMNADPVGGTMIGASSSQLLRMLADCYLDILQPGDEIVIDESGHEANINPWVRLEKFGIKVVWWRVDPDRQNATLAGLERCLSDRTKLVVFPHVSNLLGEVNDVAAIVRRVHKAGAETVVDGVAYAPHGPVDVAAWGCDWYCFSIYKVFGPHMACIFGKKAGWEKLDGPNHFFIPKKAFPYKFELGCQNHEGCAGLLGFGEYLRECVGSPGDGVPSRTDIESAWRLWQAAEAPLTDGLLAFLASKSNVRVVGPSRAGSHRFGIVSFVSKDRSPRSIVDALVAKGIACREGHMYAYRLLQALDIDPSSGVVRVSFVHYNTSEELDRAIRVLDEIL